MIQTAAAIALAAFSLALLLNLYRLIRGPDAVDRVLALDTIYVNTIAVIILLGIVRSTPVYFEAALIIATVGFVGTAAFAKYLGSGVIE